MTDGANRRAAPQFETVPLMTSAALIGVGTALVVAGLAVGGSHLLLATRRWVSGMEVPPGEFAKLKWARARTAVSAAASAWQDGSPA